MLKPSGSDNMCSNDEHISKLASIESASQSVSTTSAASPRNSHQISPKSVSSIETNQTTTPVPTSTPDNTSLLRQLQKTSPYHRQNSFIHPHRHQPPVTNMSSMLGGNSVVPPGILPPLDHYRLQLYNYAVAERLRCSQYSAAGGQLPICGPGYSPAAAAAAAAAVSAGNSPYAPSRFALSMSFFHNRVFQPEEPKPQHSYIGLIAMAILNSPETKLVLSDIYQHILDNYPYFRTRGPGWRNSIRHNLSLNDCFIKAGRSANGKGHYWAIHPANLEDFKKGDFRRRKAQRKVRKHMGLAVDDEGTDSSSPPPLALTPPPPPPGLHPSQSGLMLNTNTPGGVQSAFCAQSWAAAVHAQAQAAAVAAAASTVVHQNQQSTTASLYSQSSRKRQFDVASLLAPDDDEDNVINRSRSRSRSPSLPFVESSRLNRIFSRNQPAAALLSQSEGGSNHAYKGSAVKRLATVPAEYDDSENEDIDVVASDAENNNINFSHGNNNNIPEDNVRFMLGLNENVADDEEEECVIEDVGGHHKDAASCDHSQQYQSRRSHHHHQQHRAEFEQHPQMAFAEAEDNNDNQLNETSNDSQPTEGSNTNRAAAAAAASWQGIIQQWPGNFQQHFNNPASAVNSRFLQRYYGQYMAAAAAQQVAVAAVTAKNAQHQSVTPSGRQKTAAAGDLKLVELTTGSVDPMTLISRGDGESGQSTTNAAHEEHHHHHHNHPSSNQNQHQESTHHQQQQQQHHQQHQSPCNQHSLKASLRDVSGNC